MSVMPFYKFRILKVKIKSQGDFLTFCPDPFKHACEEQH